MADELKLKISVEAAQAKEALAQAQAASRGMASEISHLQSEIKAFTAIKIQNELDGFKAGAKDAAREIRQFQVQLSETQATKLVLDDSIRNLKRFGSEAQSSSRIAKEGFITASSEIIESWGVDGDIANELAKMLAALPPQAKLGLAAVAAAFIAAAGAAAALVLATKHMVDVAGEVGTKNKDDFDRFAKSIKEAGGEVTKLDRALSQELVRSVDQVKAATDNLFLILIRESGPQAIVLLRTVKDEINKLEPAAHGAGQAMALSFLVANAALVTLNETLLLGGEALGLFIKGGEVNRAKAIADLIKLLDITGRFDQNLRTAAEAAAGLSKTLPRATFDSKGTDRSGQDALQGLRDLQKLQLEDLQRFREQVKREYDLRLLDEEVYTGVLIEAENERLQIVKDSLDKQEAVARAKLKASDLNKEIERVNRERLRAEEEHADNIEKIQEESAKRRLQLGIQLQQAIFQHNQAARNRQQAAIQDEERERRITHEQAEAELSEIVKEAVLERIKLANDEVERAGVNTVLLEIAVKKREALEIELAEVVEEAERRKREARRRDIEEAIRLGIEQRESQVRNLQGEGFDESQAKAIAEFEAAMRRSATVLEALRISIRQWAIDAQKEIPKISAVFSQMQRAIAPALASSIAAFTSGRATMRQAAAAFYSAALQPLVDYLQKLAVAEFAQGTKDLAAQNYPGAALHFLAGAGLSAAAGFVGGGVAGLIAGGGSPASGGALGQAVTGTRQDDSTRSTEDRIRFIERDAAGRARNDIRITIVTDQEQQIKNVEQGALASHRRGGLISQIIDEKVSGIGLTTG